MRLLTIFRRVSVLVLLLGIAGCGSTSYLKKGPEKKTNIVKVSNCLADPDTAQVAKGDTLTWTPDPPDGYTYSITFPHSTPLPSASASIGQGQKVTGNFWCNNVGGIAPSLCVYPYNLVQKAASGTMKVCPDPGVHVVPGS